MRVIEGEKNQKLPLSILYKLPKTHVFASLGVKLTPEGLKKSEISYIS